MSSNRSANQKTKTVFECKLWSDKYKSSDYTTRIRQVGRYIQFSVLRPSVLHCTEAGSSCKTIADNSVTIGSRNRATPASAIHGQCYGHTSALNLRDERSPASSVPALLRPCCGTLRAKASTSRKRNYTGAKPRNSTKRCRKLDCMTLCSACHKPHPDTTSACTSHDSNECDVNAKPETDSSSKLAVAIGQQVHGRAGGEDAS